MGDAGDQGMWMHIMGADEMEPGVRFTANPGPRIRLPTTSSPLHYFELFVTDELIALIVRETNRYAQQWIAGHQKYLQAHRHSRVHAWIREGETTPEEVRAFLGVVFNIGLIKKNKY